jgi:hypothetical protein
LRRRNENTKTLPGSMHCALKKSYFEKC